jgi:TetR/AcrR family transcriptional regulator
MKVGAEINELDQTPGGVRPTTLQKREQIVDVAMRHFAERGYEGTHVHDLAAELGIAKGSIFQHFGSKEGLFLAAYRRAVLSFDRYLDAPDEVTTKGFFATIRHWLDRAEHLVREDWVPYRVALLGAHGSDLAIKREINRFLAAEDPYGTAEFLRFGVERGEVRADIDEGMLVAMVDWLMERFQDALVTEELDPGLFQRRGSRVGGRETRIEQFLELLRSAIGVRGARRRASGRRSSR